MASIRDVARLAGVSTATVSKHINKAGYVSPSKRDAIERAMESLHYAPNRSARQLKTHASREVLLVLPGMEEGLYQGIMKSVDAQLGGEYRLVIQLTSDRPEKERAILRDCLSNPCAGVLLMTCVPGDTELFTELAQRVPLIFLVRKPACVEHFSFLGFNHFDTIFALVSELIRLNRTDIGLYTGDVAFSSESECVEAFKAAYTIANLKVADNRVFSFPLSREGTFRSIMHLFDSGQYPPVFLTTSYACAAAIQEVAYFRDMELGRDLFLFTLGEDSWYNSLFVNKIVCTFRDAQKLGSLAVTTLMEQIASPGIFTSACVELDDGFAFSKVGDYMARLAINAPTPRARVRVSRLKIAFNATDSGTDALKCLIPQFTKETNVEVTFDLLPHHALYDALLSCARRKVSDYDLFSIDAPWLPYLDQQGLLVDLTDFVYRSELPGRLAPRVLENIATLDGRVLGVPYMYVLQVLFYRKDLFSDPQLRSQFHQLYRVDLEPPTTWNMYNAVASFFTRSVNPSSPTEYGTSIFGAFPAAICSELLPRIWGYGGTVFDARGCVRLYSRENMRAYDSLITTIRLSPPGAMLFDAFAGVTKLIAGDTAMCVYFSHNASPLADSARNPIRDKLGFAPIPGRKPVISGWSIGINRYSPCQEDARRFISWFSSMELSSAFSILGGSSPMSALLEHEPLMQIYPWNAVALQEYHTALPRQVPCLPGVPVLDELAVESILSSVVFDYFDEKGSLNDLLKAAHLRLCSYAEAHGYPKNIHPKSL